MTTKIQSLKSLYLFVYLFGILLFAVDVVLAIRYLQQIVHDLLGCLLRVLAATALS